jgi:hypothetical protein
MWPGVRAACGPGYEVYFCGLLLWLHGLLLWQCSATLSVITHMRTAHAASCMHCQQRTWLPHSRKYQCSTIDIVTYVITTM